MNKPLQKLLENKWWNGERRGGLFFKMRPTLPACWLVVHCHISSNEKPGLEKLVKKFVAVSFHTIFRVDQMPPTAPLEAIPSISEKAWCQCIPQCKKNVLTLGRTENTLFGLIIAFYLHSLIYLLHLYKYFQIKLSPDTGKKTNSDWLQLFDKLLLKDQIFSWCT